MYFYAREGREYGPVPADRLVELFDQGVISPGDAVRVDGTTSFRDAARMVETLRGVGRPARLARAPLHEAHAAGPHPRAAEGAGSLVSAPPPAPHATLIEAPQGAGRAAAPFVSAPPPAPHATLIEAPPVAGAKTLIVSPLVTDGAGRDPLAGVADFAVGTVAPPRAAARVIDSVPPTLASAEPSDAVVIELDGAGGREAGPEVPTDPSPGIEPAPRAARGEATDQPGAPRRAGPVARRAPVASRGASVTASRPPPSSGSAGPGAVLVELVGGRAGATGVGLVVLALGTLAFLALRFTAELRGAFPPPGTKVVLSSSLTMDSGRVTLKRGANSTTGAVSLRQESSTVLESLGVDSFRLSFPIERTERVIHLTGQPPVPESRVGDLAGRSVLVEGPEGGRKKTLEGPPPTEREQRRLEALVTDPRDPYPDGRAWPGRTWSVDPRWFCRSMTLDEECGGSALMELERFVRYRGERVAQIQLHASIRGRHEGLAVEVSLVGQIYRALDLGVDLETRATGQIHVTGEIQAGADGSALMEIDGPITLVERAER